MNSFSNEKMKELVTLLQLLVTAMVGIDKETGELNENQIYNILQSISGTDEERTADINGTLQEQVKALNDNIISLKTAIEQTNEHLDYIDNVVGFTSGTAFVKTMLPDGLIWQ